METWIDAGIYHGQKVVDLRGKYEISSEGRVRRKNHFLKQRLGPLGQLTVRVYVDGVTHILTVARIMAEAWGIPNDFCGDEIKYRDGNKQNLSLDNLYWTMDNCNLKTKWKFDKLHKGEKDWFEMIKQKEAEMTWENGCYYRKFLIEFKDGSKETLWARSPYDCRRQIRKQKSMQNRPVVSIKDFKMLCKGGVKL